MHKTPWSQLAYNVSEPRNGSNFHQQVAVAYGCSHFPFKLSRKPPPDTSTLFSSSRRRQHSLTACAVRFVARPKQTKTINITIEGEKRRRRKKERKKGKCVAPEPGLCVQAVQLPPKQTKSGKIKDWERLIVAYSRKVFGVHTFSAPAPLPKSLLSVLDSQESASIRFRKRYSTATLFEAAGDIVRQILWWLPTDALSHVSICHSVRV